MIRIKSLPDNLVLADENGNLLLRDSDDLVPEDKKYPWYRDKNGNFQYDEDGNAIMFPDERDNFILGPGPGDRHGLFAARSLHLIQGASGSGKTTFALQMLQAQAEGRTLLGRETPWPKSVLVVWQDRGPDELRRQLENLGMDKNPPPYVLVSDRHSRMAPSEALEEIFWDGLPNHSEMAHRQKPKLPDVLFVEGLDLWLPDDVKNLKLVADHARAVRDLAVRENISIIATIGAPKSKPKEGYASPRDRAIGSTAWSRVADTVVDITADPETQERTVSLLSRTDKTQVVKMSFQDGLLVPRLPAIPVLINRGPPAAALPSIREIMKTHGCRYGKAKAILAELAGTQRNGEH